MACSEAHERTRHAAGEERQAVMQRRGQQSRMAGAARGRAMRPPCKQHMPHRSRGARLQGCCTGPYHVHPSPQQMAAPSPPNQRTLQCGTYSTEVLNTRSICSACARSWGSCGTAQEQAAVGATASGGALAPAPGALEGGVRVAPASGSRDRREAGRHRDAGSHSPYLAVVQTLAGGLQLRHLGHDVGRHLAPRLAGSLPTLAAALTAYCAPAPAACDLAF